MNERGPIAWFVRNRVAANILMILIVAAGIFSIPRIKTEVFPEFSADMITIGVPYPGAAPEEVEEGICRKIEDRLEGLNGIEKVTSSAAEGAGAVTVEVRAGEDLGRVLREVKTQVDAIDSFPEDAEKPVVSEVIPRNQVINVTVSGPVDERVLKRLGERVRDDLLALDEITQVTLTIARPDEVSIEVSEENLRRFGLSFDEVAGAVRRWSLDVPGGAIKSEGGEILLRTKGQAYDREAFASIVVRSRPDGTRLLLGDVATIVDGFAETDQAARFDGLPAVVLQVFRVGDENALEISDAVKDFCLVSQPNMPEGVTLTPWRDDARYLRGRLQTLFENGIMGLILVFGMLVLFLRLRLSFWVTLGIPISFTGTLILMPMMDQSINVLSLFAFIVVLGIVVDDAIVVGESIYKRIQRGEEGELAATEGARRVATPVIFAVLTSVAAFVPMASLPGFTGKIWRVIPLVVIPTLLWSLVESLWILPPHLVHVKSARSRHPVAQVWYRFQGITANGLERFIEKVYQPSVRLALRARYVTLATAVGTLIMTAGLIGGGILGFEFFPKLPADDLACQVTMPLGTPATVTEQAVRRIELAGLEVMEEVRLQLEDELGEGNAPIVAEHLLASVGEQPWRQSQSQNRGVLADAFTGAHLGEVHIALAPAETRGDDPRFSPDLLVERWREKVGGIAGAEEVSFTSELMGAGKPIDVRLAHEDLDTLRDAAEALKQELQSLSGVDDVSDSYRAGKRELRFEVTPAGAALGVTNASLGLQMRQTFYGEEAQRIQRGTEEVKVMVRYPEIDRRTAGALDDWRVRLPDGREAPFDVVARAVEGRGSSTISRTDGRRTLNVTAEVDNKITSSGAVFDHLMETALPSLGRRYPGLSWEKGGERQEQDKTLSGLLFGMYIALIVIYGLMAIPFRSYLQPLIVMTAIPFGMVGALLGHLVIGMSANVLSMCGMLALAGVVVNDNLVLVDTINRRRREGGGDLVSIVCEAGASRFRPILLTSLTTFAGLTPLMLETSLQAQFLIPMAVSLAFGVMFSTMVSLILVPSLYLILEDLVSGLVGPVTRAIRDAFTHQEKEAVTE